MNLLNRRFIHLGAPVVLGLALSACQTAPAVIRYSNGSPAAITSKAVEVPAGNSMIFVSGNTATPARPDAAPNSPEYWGDTETQTRAALKKIDATLHEMHLTMADVAKVQAFVVAPAGATAADLAGFNRGFSTYFGAASNGQLPSRTLVQIAALGHPNVLVEIEVMAVRPIPAQAKNITHVR